MIRDVILVTGAPRSGTTPLGDLVSRIKGSVNLYEPMGLTGDRRFHERFPMPGEPGFSSADLLQFVDDMKRLKLSFKSQSRPSHKGLSGVAARIFGTRSLMSYRKARLSPNSRLLIWKDPHAIFCAAEGPITGAFRSVITVRPPLAHAASFKRLGWISQAVGTYQRYRLVYGDIPNFRDWCERFGDSAVGSAALLWHMVHRRVVEMPVSARNKLFLLNMETVAQDELAAYRKLFDWLVGEMPEAVARTMEQRSRLAKKRGDLVISRGVHDFNRTAAQANSYWRDVLNEEEVALVREINGALWSQLIQRA